MYQPEVHCAVPAQVVRKRRVAKSNHYTSAKPLAPLFIGQPIRVKAHPQPAHTNWKPRVIVDSVAPCSYIVEVDGRKYHRNRVHLCDTIQSSQAQPNGQQTSTAETADSSTNHNASQDDSSSTPPLPEQSPSIPSSVDPMTPPTSSPVTRIRSGRVVKPNTLLRDCSIKDFIIRRSCFSFKNKVSRLFELSKLRRQILVLSFHDLYLVLPFTVTDLLLWKGDVM